MANGGAAVWLAPNSRRRCLVRQLFRLERRPVRPDCFGIRRVRGCVPMHNDAAGEPHDRHDPNVDSGPPVEPEETANQRGRKVHYRGKPNARVAPAGPPSDARASAVSHRLERWPIKPQPHLGDDARSEPRTRRTPVRPARSRSSDASGGSGASSIGSPTASPPSYARRVRHLSQTSATPASLYGPQNP